MLRVFLCHSSGDKPAVRDLYRRLCEERFSPWLDEKDLIPGQDWAVEIARAVRKSDVVIVCLSRSSITKEGFVQREIRQALDVADEKPEGTIFIIPLKLEDCEVPERLRRWHWVNLYESNGYEGLLRALRKREAGHPGQVTASEPTPASFVAPRCPQQARNEAWNLLLRLRTLINEDIPEGLRRSQGGHFNISEYSAPFRNIDRAIYAYAPFVSPSITNVLRVAAQTGEKLDAAFAVFKETIAQGRDVNGPDVLGRFKELYAEVQSQYESNLVKWAEVFRESIETVNLAPKAQFSYTVEHVPNIQQADRVVYGIRVALTANKSVSNPSLDLNFSVPWLQSIESPRVASKLHPDGFGSAESGRGHKAGGTPVYRYIPHERIEPTDEIYITVWAEQPIQLLGLETD